MEEIESTEKGSIELCTIVHSLDAAEEALGSILEIVGSTALALCEYDIEAVNKQRDAFLEKVRAVKTGLMDGIKGLEGLKSDQEK